MKFRHLSGARLTLADGRVALVGKQWRELPDDFYQEALVRGCHCDKTVIEERPEIVPASSENAVVQLDEKKVIKEGIELLLARLDEGDMTGSGLPNLKVLTKVCGFAVDKQTMLEVWKDLQASQAVPDPQSDAE